MKRLLILFFALAGTLSASPLDELLPRPKAVTPGNGEWTFRTSEVKEERRVADEVLAGKPGGYMLEVQPTGATLFAEQEEGMRYARATLRQLVALGKGRVPCCRIVDYPTFAIRGMLHDTGRNWQPIGQLKKQLDRMADYKLNVFQWHLTDNPGWRLQSRKYPQLSRAENLDRTKRFYTQEEFKALIAYARERGITVIPELDVPGHSATFRRAFGLKRMDEPRVRGIVRDLFEELAGLLDPAVTPYIHVGSDEVQPHERVPGEWLAEWITLLQEKGFKVIAWGPGQHPPKLKEPLIRQYWMGRQVRRDESEPYIDSQSSYYINHVDPLELLAPATYQKPCLTGTDATRLGAIFAVWHDDAVSSPTDLLTMNPVYPALVLYSDAFWNGREKDDMRYYGNLPDPRDALFAQAEELERRLMEHKPLFAKEPFPYWKQTDLRWRMARTGDTTIPFEVLPWEERIIAQGTLYPKHFFFRQSDLVNDNSGAVTFGMIVTSDRDRTVPLYADFMNYSRSDGRSRDLPIVQGQWNAKGAQLLINGVPVPPPRWERPGVSGAKSREIPLTNELWVSRPPCRVRLRKGENTVRIILPKKGWKWSATCFFPETEGLTFAPPERKAEK